MGNSDDPAQPGHKWPSGSTVKFYLPVKFSDAAKRAILRWNEFTLPLGIKLKPIGLWPWQNKTGRLGDGKNSIYFTPTIALWSDAPIIDNGNSIIESDVRLSATKPYDADSVYICCLHEIGHCLGIGHVEAKYSIMNERGPAYVQDLAKHDPALNVLRRIYT